MHNGIHVSDSLFIIPEEKSISIQRVEIVDVQAQGSSVWKQVAQNSMKN